MHFEFVDKIAQLAAPEWDALWSSAHSADAAFSYPFTQYGFLHSLEASGSTGPDSGWIPQHLIAKDEQGALVFAMPLYIKSHSYGEYVFDWSWADAYAHHGLNYYPKIVNATPFTPATGPRWAFHKESVGDIEQLSEQVMQQLYARAEQLQASGIHCLFPCTESAVLFQSSKTLKFSRRSGSQYHWFNNNYANFDQFLAEFASRKRKNIRKERLKTSDFKVEFLPAKSVSTAQWSAFYQLYHRTYFKRSGRPGYLGPDFFPRLAKYLPEQLLLAQVCAVDDEDKKMLAGAVYFKDSHCLYGRYWGAQQEFDGLHFETCYYKGIEYAIEQGLQRFDPGAQGEHKIQRGFQPIETQSFHWLGQPEFAKAVDTFCQEEHGQIHAYIDDARGYLPFKEGVTLQASTVLIGTKTTEVRTENESEASSDIAASSASQSKSEAH